MTYRPLSLFTLVFLYGAVGLAVIVAETQISTDTSWVSSLESPGSYWHIRDTQVDSPDWALRLRDQ